MSASNQIPEGAPTYRYKGQILFLLDQSEVGQMMAAEAVHLMGTVMSNGEVGIFAATPEFVAEILANGERLP